MSRMSRFVVRPPEPDDPNLGVEGVDVEPLEDTDLVVVDASDPRDVLSKSSNIIWAAPTMHNGDEESYPTGEISVRLHDALDQANLEHFVRDHGVELRRRNEFVPEQIVVAPSGQQKTWLPDLVERLNTDVRVTKAWPNTLSRYQRV
jgi:hypothetical protein